MTTPGRGTGPDLPPQRPVALEPPEPPRPAERLGSTDASDALARATRALQGEDEPGWPHLAERVSRRLRTVSRPGRSLTVQVGEAGTLRVDQRVVVDTVRRAVSQVPGCRPVDVTVLADEQVVTALRVHVWVTYGTDVVSVAAVARAAAAGSLEEVLGRLCPVDVDVVGVDVVDDVKDTDPPS